MSDNTTNIGNTNYRTYNISQDISAKKISWLKTGGIIKELFEPKTNMELSEFLSENYQAIEPKKYRVLGACTNTLLPDSTLPFIIRLNHFQKIELQESNVQKSNAQESHEIRKVYVESGVLSSKLIRFCIENEIGGLEFMATIPGSIGGMIKMNAGAYGSEIKDVLIEAIIMEEDGSIKHYSPKELEFSYRHSAIKSNQIVLGGIFKVFFQSAQESSQIISKMQQHRKDSQPLQRRSLGSTFKNPTNNGEFYKGEVLSAWKLIDDCGLRGYRIGDAQISEKHTNFIENLGQAKSEDVLALINLAKSKVKEKFNIELEIENEIL